MSVTLHYISPWGVVYPMAGSDFDNLYYVRPTSLASETGKLSPKTKQLHQALRVKDLSSLMVIMSLAGREGTFTHTAPLVILTVFTFRTTYSKVLPGWAYIEYIYKILDGKHA